MVEIAIVVGRKTFSSIVRPEHKIEIEAMATHHLRDQDVAKASSLTKVLLTASSLFAADDVEITSYAAHNAKFDSGFLPGLAAKWICTFRCAQHVWPDAPSYSNQVLRYWLPGVDAEVRKHSSSKLPPHRALPDAYVTSRILDRLLREKTEEELIELTEKPIIQKLCRFGKYYGCLWERIPRDFLIWLLSKGPERVLSSGRKEGFSEDIRHTAKFYLEKSNKNNRL